MTYLTGVKIGRAKQLLNADFKKIADVAEAEAHQLTKAIQYLSKEKVSVRVDVDVEYAPHGRQLSFIGNNSFGKISNALWARIEKTQNE